MILVTGGTGFLGAYIIRGLIEKGHAVRAIRRSSQLPFYIDKNILDQVEWIDGDVLDIVSLDEAMEGLDGVIINPSTILGFGNWHQSSCAIFKNAYREFPWYTEGINGFVGVEDVAEASIQLLFSDLDQKRFIINSEDWSFRKLFDTMAD